MARKGGMDTKTLAWKGAKWYLGIGAVWAGIQTADRLIRVARGSGLPPWKLPEADRMKSYVGWLASPLQDLALWPYAVVNTVRGVVQVAAARSKAGQAFPVEMVPVIGAFKAPELPKLPNTGSGTTTAGGARAEAFELHRGTRHALSG